MFSAFQQNSFQSNAFQINGSGLVIIHGPNNERHKKPGKKKKYEYIVDQLDEILAEYREKPEQVSTDNGLQNLIEEIRDTDIPVPVSDYFLSYSQIQEIKQIILIELRRLYLLQEDEDFFILFAATL